jgi:hypothetical protein
MDRVAICQRVQSLRQFCHDRRNQCRCGGGARAKQIAHVRGEGRNGNSISQLLRRIGTTEENPMTGKYLIAAALVSACAVAASAQTTTEYYVVQDSATKKCTIVDKKPTTTTMLQVGPVAFKTRTEAEAGMKTITVCSSN